MASGLLPFWNRNGARADAARPGRNDPCPCGSGRKFKQCCALREPPKPQTAAPAPAPVSEPALDTIRSLRDAGRFLEATRLAQDYVTRHGADHQAHAELGLVHLHAGNADAAITSLLRAVRLSPSTATYHEHAAIALAQVGRDDEAIRAFQATIKLDPKNAGACTRLAEMFRMHERNEAAAAAYQRAADGTPDKVEGLLNRVRAKQMRGERDLPQIEPLLCEAVAKFPDSSEAKRMLAGLLRENGRFDEAIPLLEEATEGTPIEAATSYADLVNSKRITPDDQILVDQMLKLIDYGPLPEGARVWLNFALGKAYNDLGQYNEAMRYYDAGNALVSTRRPFDRAKFGAGVERLIANTSQELFEAHSDRGSLSELPVLIVGMPRSGTTLVEQILSSHREVAAGDELPFWNNTWEKMAQTGRTDLSPEYLQSVAKDYEAVLRKIGPVVLRVTDKTPGNFLMLGLFHLAFPRGRIIHLRRSPVDTCLSNYFVNFMVPMSYTYNKEHLVFYSRTYRRLMAHWRKVLPPEILLDMDYEALVTDPEHWTRRMIDFVGLPWDDACLRPQDNTRTVRTASQWQVRQPTNRGSVDRWRRYEKSLGALKDLLRNPDPDGDVSPQTENAAIARARTLRRENRPDEAIAAIQAALRADGNDEVLYNELGTLFLEGGSLVEAKECFERAIGLNANFAVAHYNLAVVHERQGNADGAIAYHRRTLALDPRLGGAWSRLGNLLQAQGQSAEALECFRNAQTLLPNPAEQELEEAKILRGEDRDKEAEAKLNRVVALAPDNPMAHAMLGDILSEAGRFDEALTHLRRAAELDPDRVTVLFNIALFKKLTEEDRPLIARMESLLSMPTRTDIEKTLLNFSLGKAYDDLNQPARAISFYDAGNAREHARQPFDREALARAIDAIIARFAQPRSAPDAEPSDRPVFIVGMPRSGTTLTEQILSSHPRVAGAGELIFWPEVVEGTRPVSGAAKAYLDRLATIAPDADRVTDKNPFNFLNLGLIRAQLPNARFVHCRRNPIDTCLSIYFTRFTKPQPFAYDRGDIAFYYRQYQRLMDHWRASLPADTLMDIDYETLVADSEPAIRALIDFVGLPWDDACLRPQDNTRAIRTASLWQARQPVYRSSVARWQRFEPWLGELGTLAP